MMKKTNDIIISNGQSNETSVDCNDEMEQVYIKEAQYGPIKYRINQTSYFCNNNLIGETELTPGIDRSEYELRRKRLFCKLPKQSTLILPSNPECKFSADGAYKYRQDATFNYFTGLQAPYSLAILTKDCVGKCKYILFVRSIIKSEVTWHGHRCGLEAAKFYFGANEAYDWENVKKLKEFIGQFDKIYFEEDVNDAITMEIKDLIKQCNSNINNNNNNNNNNGGNNNTKIRILKPSKIYQRLRVIKSESEINLLRASAEISALSMIDTMKYCEPGMLENELYVQFEYGCKKRGASQLSFGCSVASGINATHLSYFNNNSQLKPGDLCLIDCGCEYNGYASDITRTFPINGKFTTAQKELYQMMLDISTKLISSMVVGCTIKKLETESAKLIKNGLKKLGITSKLQNHEIKNLKISSADVHYVAHFVGLDIHDTSDIPHSELFKPNMVLAIEPAIYIPDHDKIPPKYRNIGIRIEDDVLITNNKPEILSKSLPRTIQEIEDIMKEQSRFERIIPFSLRRDNDNDNDDNNDNIKQQTNNQQTNNQLEVRKYVY